MRQFCLELVWDSLSTRNIPTLVYANNSDINNPKNVIHSEKQTSGEGFLDGLTFFRKFYLRGFSIPPEVYPLSGLEKG